MISNGWSTELPTESDFVPFYRRQNELSLLQGCIMWGTRVVIPSKLRVPVLEELHQGHLGI